MRIQRQHSATRAFLVLAMVFASLWAGGLASSAAGNAADQLASSRSLPGVEPAAPRDRVPALRPPDRRPSQSGRLVPVLLGMLAATLAVGYGVGAGQLGRPGCGPGRWSRAPSSARAPPPSSRPDRRPSPCPRRRGRCWRFPTLSHDTPRVAPCCRPAPARRGRMDGGHPPGPAGPGPAGGGTQIVLEATDSPDRRVDGDTLARTLEVLRRQVDQLEGGRTDPAARGSAGIIVDADRADPPSASRSSAGRMLAFLAVGRRRQQAGRGAVPTWPPMTRQCRRRGPRPAGASPTAWRYRPGGGRRRRARLMRRLQVARR